MAMGETGRILSKSLLQERALDRSGAAQDVGGESKPALRAILPGRDDLERRGFSECYGRDGAGRKQGLRL